MLLHQRPLTRLHGHLTPGSVMQDELLEESQWRSVRAELVIRSHAKGHQMSSDTQA
jgi:hypothetical protein